jgi:hypothetical protein
MNKNDTGLTLTASHVQVSRFTVHHNTVHHNTVHHNTVHHNTGNYEDSRQVTNFRNASEF